MADSVRDALFGGGAKPREISHYELRVIGPGEGTWRVPEFDHDLGDLSGLDEPLDEEAVANTAETEGWPSGKYKLQGRYTDGTMAPTEWTIDHEGPGDEEEERELTEEEKIERAAQRAIQREKESGPAIASPDEAMGAVFERALSGRIPAEVDMDQLAGFIDSWESMSRSPPSTPDEVAGMTWQAHVAEGNTDAATAILSDWMNATRGEEGGSLVDRALEDGDANISMDTIKALGILKFLDDPRGMVRETAGGMLEADSRSGEGDEGGRRGLAGVLGDLSDGDGAGANDDVDTADAGDGDADRRDPRRPSTAVAVDVDELGSESAGEAAAATAEAAATTGAPDGEGETPPQDATAETAPTDDTAAADDGETDDTTGLDEAMNDIEEGIDREAGEYPNAAEAMVTLEAAAEQDDAAAADPATDGGDPDGQDGDAADNASGVDE